MAKAKKNELIEEVVIVDDVEITKKEDVITDEVILEKPVPVVPEKKVRVRLSGEHRCCIGGEWYYFKQDKVYNVPENVKTILMKAGKLSPM